MTVPPDYPALLLRLDAWHQGVRDRFPGIVPCRAGCTACCHGPFDVSVADALEIGRAVARLGPVDRAAITARSLAQVGRMTGLAPQFRAPWDLAAVGEAGFDALSDALADDPCPALDSTGRCLIYHGRPLVCRMMGAPMRSGTEVLGNDCPIQDEFPGYRDLAPQPFDLADWEDGETDALRAAAALLFGDPGRSRYETTIAGAVLLAPR